MSMIHASNYKPRVVPWNPSVTGNQIDRVQELGGSITLNREKLKEVGRSAIVDWRQKIPSLTGSMRQFEYGSVEFYQMLANTSTLGLTSQTALSLNDFKTPRVDIMGYKTDDDDTFVGTIWYPKLRTSSFSINIGDPEALVERNFEMVGEDEIILLNNNKYLIYGYETVESGEGGGAVDIVIGTGDWSNYPTPVEDPDNSGSYMLRVTRVRSSVVEDLTETTDYTYINGTQTLSILAAQDDDVYCFIYSATTYISGSSTFTSNDSDISAVTADSCSIYLQTSDYVYKLQSVGIDINFDRTDYKEIGNSEVVQTGARDKTVRITLGRFLDRYTTEEILRGVGGSSYGKIDARQYLDNLTLKIKMYNSSSKDTFLMGYKFTGLAPTDFDSSTPVDEYIQRNATLEGEDGTISEDESLT